MQPVVSRQNPRFKALRTIVEDPRGHGRALADGIHLVSVCIDRGGRIEQMLVSESGRRKPEIIALLERVSGVESMVLGDALFRELTNISNPTGIAAVFEPPREPSGPLRGDAVLLDSVQDAGNVGAILRTTAAAGIVDVLLSPGCAGAWGLKVLRAAQGAHFGLRIREQADLLSAIDGNDALVIGTVAHGGQSLYDLDLTRSVCWLFGNEGSGLSTSLLDVASVHATLPLAAGTESLNVAAAAAICLFEARRQRMQTKRPAQSGPSW